MTLDPVEAELLGAILDRLVPADKHGPGAREAGVLRYVERSLGDALAASRPSYAENLPAVDALARGRHGCGFVELDPAQQDAVLRSIEADEPPGFTPSARAFFDLVRLHAIQGMFGDPAHGGNIGFAGWELIGFPGVKPVTPAGDQALDAAVSAVRRGRDG